MPPKKLKLDSTVFFSGSYPYNAKKKLGWFTKYLNDENKPFYQLEKAIQSPDPKIKSESDDTYGDYIVHLLIRDFRLQDNPGLENAARFASTHKKPLIVVYPYCLENFSAHGMSSWQLKYLFNLLQLLKPALQSSNVPLVVLNINSKADMVSSLTQFFSENNVKQVFANIEYEVDELRMFLALQNEPSIRFHPYHHSCVVKPSELTTKSGTQYSVFTPWYKSWLALIKSDKKILQPSPPPDFDNSDQYKKELEPFWDEKYSLPDFPWEFSNSNQKYFDKHYKISDLDEPLKQFKGKFKTEIITKYDDMRNKITDFNSSRVSHHLALGALTTRILINELISAKLISSVDSGNKHVVSYVRELAWRDFYKHILCNWPHVCMHRPFQLDYTDVKWEHSEEHYKKWCTGTTGFPIVDASMRQLLHTGYMNNRCRMIVASFFAKNLLLDWRLGEDFFVKHLIDGDFASNNGGWGFSASVGVDPQPYFRVFNPYLQSERFDKEGDFIREWVPELADIKGKHIHNPFDDEESEKIARKNGYTSPCVDYKKTRQRAIDRFKDAK